MDADRRAAPELATLADLPFHVLGRHPKPLLVGQVTRAARSTASPRATGSIASAISRSA